MPPESAGRASEAAEDGDRVAPLSVRAEEPGGRERGDAAGQPARPEFQREEAAEGVAGDVRPLAGRDDRLEQVDELTDEVVEHVPDFRQVGGSSVPGQVDDDHPEPVGEQRHHSIPGVHAVADAVDEDDGRSGSGDLVIQTHALSVHHHTPPDQCLDVQPHDRRRRAYIRCREASGGEPVSRGLGSW